VAQALVAKIASRSKDQSDQIIDSEPCQKICMPCNISFLFPTDIILYDESIQAIDVGSIPIHIHTEEKSSSVALQDIMQTVTITPAELMHMHITVVIIIPLI
jgi:hypothetical protein